MKTRRVISVFAILCAGGLVLYLSKPAKAGRSSSNHVITSEVPTGVVVNPGEPASAGEVAGPEATPSRETTGMTAWARIESDDLREFIGNLRRAGCPEETIRDVVTFRVARKYYARLLATKAGETEAWPDPAHPAPVPTRASGPDQLALRAEMDRELASLLGANPDELKSMASRGSNFEYGESFLPLAKEMRVREIRELYRRLSNEARAELEYVADQELRLKLQRLEQEREAEIAAILSPAERDAHYLRHSRPAVYARSQLPVAMDENEFRKLVRAVEESRVYEPQPSGGGALARFGTRYGIPNPLEKPDTTAQAEQSLRQARLHERLKQSLGEERYRELFASEGM